MSASSWQQSSFEERGLHQPTTNKGWFLDSTSPTEAPTVCTVTAASVAASPAKTDKDPSRDFGDLCKHWKTGYCHWGTKCRFVHGTDSTLDVVEPHRELNGSVPSAFIATARTSISSRTSGLDVQVAGDSANDESPAEAKAPHLSGGARLWAHIFLSRPHPEFDLVPMLIGKSGKHIVNIHFQTQAKIRIRGQGSGHKEVQHADGTSSEALRVVCSAMYRNLQHSIVYGIYSNCLQPWCMHD